MFQFQIRLPALPTLISEDWPAEPRESCIVLCHIMIYKLRHFHFTLCVDDYRGKIRRRSRIFKPVLARIFEKDYDHPVNYEDLSEMEMKYFSMFDRHRADEVICQDVGMFITTSNKS